MKRKIDFIILISCIVTVVTLSSAFIFLPQRQFSSAENRNLKSKPTLSMSNVMSGRYTVDLGEYISDHFPAREVFVTTKAYTELLLGKHENNGIIYGKNDTLIDKSNVGGRLEENLNIVKQFEKSVNAPVYLAILPSSIDVFAENLPKNYSTKQNDKLWQQFFKYTENLNLKAVNLYAPLCEKNYYYRTDHHFTSYGAYQTYQILGNTMGYTPKISDFFTTETVTNQFCGTSMRTSAFYLCKKDEITLFRYDDDTLYKVVADGKKIELYDFSKLNSADKYAVFLGGNHARIDISNGKNRPKMLIIRDSFADSVAPFLALHYDLTLIDLRYYNENVQNLVSSEKFDSVLILENITEFSTTKNISFLKRSLDQ